MRKVIIIGATSGIGLELAKLYVNNGDKVGVTGRRCHLLNELKQQFPEQIETACFDVTGAENILHLETFITKLTGMDILIYNSGYGEVSNELDWKIDRQTTLTNVNGFIEIVNYSFNYFIKQSKGQIAATSSVAANVPNGHAPAYSASKAFISMYMEGLFLKLVRIKKENPRMDVHVTDIQPGFIKTKMAKGKVHFWEAPTEKAARQIFKGLQKKKRKLYVTRRWRFVTLLLKNTPHFIFKRIA